MKIPCVIDEGELLERIGGVVVGVLMDSIDVEWAVVHIENRIVLYKLNRVTTVEWRKG